MFILCIIKSIKNNLGGLYEKKSYSYFREYTPGFLDASKVIVVVFENGEFNYYSAVDFGLTKIPIRIETVLTSEPIEDHDDFLSPLPNFVCENYYLYLFRDWDKQFNDLCFPGIPIAYLHHEKSIYCDDGYTNIFNYSDQEKEKYQLLIYANTLDKVRKLQPFLTLLGATGSISYDITQADDFSYGEFIKENDEALNNFYESLKRTYEAIENGNHFTGPQLTFRRGPGITTMYR